jgi:integrase
MAIPRKRKAVRNGIAYTGKGWSYVLRVPDPKTGKTKPKWVGGFDSEKSAKLARDKARVAIANRDYIPAEKVTVGEFLEKWLEIHSQRIKPTTADRYADLVHAYIVPELGGITLQALRPSHIQQFYTRLLTLPGRSGKPLSNRTVHYAGSILKKALRYAVDVDGLLTSNPASKVPLPNDAPPVLTPWSLQELKDFLDVAKSHRLFFFFWLSAFTGARRGELLALRWADFDGSSILITKSRTKAGNRIVELSTTKGGNNGQRRVILDPATVEQFSAHRKRQIAERLSLGELWNETGYVFVQENGLPLYPNTPSTVFRKLIKGAGLRATRVHDLRHLHATELLEQGEQLHVVAERLGHRDAMVTATIYAHVTNRQAETASQRFASAFSNA